VARFHLARLLSGVEVEFHELPLLQTPPKVELTPPAKVEKSPPAKGEKTPPDKVELTPPRLLVATPPKLEGVVDHVATPSCKATHLKHEAPPP
jgi:hypothetical protein